MAELRIAGVLIPDGVEANRASFIQGDTITLTVRIKNTGTESLSPYFWMRVHHRATFPFTGVPMPGSGDLIEEFTGQMSLRATDGIWTLARSYIDTNPSGWRDVVLDLYEDEELTIKIPGGRDDWQDAFAVEKATIGVGILDLTVS